MKVKILLVPLFIVISIGFSVWMVYPEFSDWSSKKDALKEAEGRVSDIDLKLENTNKLKDSLEKSSKEKEMIDQFLPESQKVEDIFEALSSIASSENVSIVNISIEKPKLEMQSLNLPPEETGNNSITAVDMGGAANSEVAIKPVSRVLLFEANLSVNGDYDKIKNIIGKVSQMKRFNNIKSLDINVQKKEGLGDGNLLANITFYFGYLERVKSIASVNNRIFSSSGFEMDSLITELEKHKNGFSPAISVDYSGRSNPFLP